MNGKMNIGNKSLLALFALGCLADCMGAPGGSSPADFKYAKNSSLSNTISITEYIGPGGAVTIPFQIDGLQVTAIGSAAFDGCHRTTNYSAKGSASIGLSDFYGGPELTSITIPGHVTEIGAWAFRSCANLTNVTIGDGVKEIDSWAFEKCTRLTRVKIPASVIRIGGGDVFAGCSALQDITVDPGNISYSSIDGVLFNKERTELIRYPCKKLGSYTIPASVTHIGQSAFRRCSGLSSVSIPGGIHRITNCAFEGCSSLTNVTFCEQASRSGVTAGIEIGNKAFAYCRSLTQVTLPDNVTRLGWAAFEGCKHLISLTLPGSVTNIGSSAFEGCSSLTNITLPDGITTIAHSTFAHCASLSGLKIPHPIADIQKDAFWACTNLTLVMIPGNVTNIGPDAFAYCRSLTGIVVAASNASYCSVDGILFNKRQTELIQYPCGKSGNFSLPCSISNLEHDPFAGCTRLTNVVIPASVTNIAGGAFDDCRNLLAINVDTANPTYCDVEGVLLDKSQTTLLRYPDGKRGRLALPATVSVIGPEAFHGCSSLTNFSVPPGITSIGYEAFQNCENLVNVTIPASVTNLDTGVFCRCEHLRGVYFEGNAPSFGGCVFYDTEAILYHLPGKAGWSETMEEGPTAIWNPRSQKH